MVRGRRKQRNMWEEELFDVPFSGKMGFVVLFAVLLCVSDIADTSVMGLGGRPW